jgi:hypothetical protein
MTVETCTGPGTATWTSDRYETTVNSVSNYVVQWDTFLQTDGSIEGSIGSAMKKCMTKWGATETVTLLVELIDGTGPVTSYEMLPDFDDVTATIVGGNLSLSVPAGRKFRLHVNGDRLKPLYVTSGPLQSSIPSGSVSFPDYVIANGMPTLIPDGTKIHFPAGEHTIPTTLNVGLVVGDNCVLHVDRNAILDSRFFNGVADNSLFQGAGYVHNTSVDPEAVWVLIEAGAVTYDELQLYSMFTSVGGSYLSTNTVKEWTLFGCGFHFISGGINRIEDTTWIAYGRGGIGNGPAPRPGGAALTSYLLRSFVDAGDDAVFATAVEGNITIQDCTVGTHLNSTVHLGYWAYGAGPDETGVNPGPLVENCHLYHLAKADTNDEDIYPAIGDQTVFACRVDATNEEGFGRGRGHYNVTIRDCRVYGPVRARLIFLRNELYPYDLDIRYDAAGNVSNFMFENLVVDETPGQLSYLVGRDFGACPNNITFKNVTIGGERLLAWNYSDFFVTNFALYRVKFNGHPMATEVDICNLALSFLGDSAQITGIDPADGSAQAEACARFYDIALNGILEMHPWGFATKYVALTEITTNERTEWDYSYQVPADMLRPLLVLPPDTIDDYPAQPANQVEFTVEQDENDDLVIYTDQEEAVLRYVAYVTNTGLFPPLFQMALSYHLAGLLAGVIIKGDEGAKHSMRCTQMMMAYLAKASANDSHTRSVKPTHLPTWMSGR